MHDEDRRLTRLRELVGRLERLPDSEHREWMLAEVRARMVDVDTGFPSQPLRPLQEAEPARETGPRRRPSKSPAPPPQPARSARVEPPEAAPPQQSSPPADEPMEDGTGPALVDGEVLSLDDSPDSTTSPPGLPGWRRGLRG